LLIAKDNLATDHCHHDLFDLPDLTLWASSDVIGCHTTIFESTSTTKFILPSRDLFIESSLPLGRAINLNPLQRLNQPDPELSLLLLAAWRANFASAADDL